MSSGEDSLRQQLEIANRERIALREDLGRVRASKLWSLRERMWGVAAVGRTAAWRLRRRLRPPLRADRAQSGDASLRTALRRHASGARRRRWTADRSREAGDWLVPILVDHFARDGSTLMMRLLASSPQIAVERQYPFERKYFAYLWRWSRMLDRTDWPEYLWAGRDLASLAQEREAAMLGAPPWLPRALMDTGRGDAPISTLCFEFAWREFSRRAKDQMGSGHAGGGEARYYAEKHLNTWEVDLGELPPVRLIALLRDPRDVYVSIRAREESGGRFRPPAVQTEQQQLDHVIRRSRRRLRWIAELLEEGEAPVIRYEDLVRDLPGVSRRVEAWLEVSLDPADAASDTRMLRRHASSSDSEASLGRWRRELDPETAERFAGELGPELQAVGIQV